MGFWPSFSCWTLKVCHLYKIVNDLKNLPAVLKHISIITPSSKPTIKTLLIITKFLLVPTSNYCCVTLCAVIFQWLCTSFKLITLVHTVFSLTYSCIHCFCEPIKAVVWATSTHLWQASLLWLCCSHIGFWISKQRSWKCVLPDALPCELCWTITQNCPIYTWRFTKVCQILPHTSTPMQYERDILHA